MYSGGTWSGIDGTTNGQLATGLNATHDELAIYIEESTQMVYYAYYDGTNGIAFRKGERTIGNRNC